MWPASGSSGLASPSGAGLSALVLRQEIDRLHVVLGRQAHKPVLVAIDVSRHMLCLQDGATRKQLFYSAHHIIGCARDE